MRIGDGYQGWPEFAPTPTAAPEEVPNRLSLETRWAVVIPVERNPVPSGMEKTGETRVTDVLPVRFVPFLDEDDVTR